MLKSRPVPLLGAGDDVGWAGGQVGGEVAAQQLRVAAVLLVEARHPGQGAQLQVLRSLIIGNRGSMSMSMSALFSKYPMSHTLHPW